MKTTLLILAGLLCFASAGQADVFVYKNKITYTLTGGGTTLKNVAAGWTVLDDSRNIVQVLAYTALKRFTIVPMQSHEFNTAIGAAGKEYSFILLYDVWTDTSGFTHIDTGGAKGMNVTTTVNGTARNIPKSFTWSGRSMGPADGSGAMKFEESAGTFSFDKNWTATANSAGDDINAAVQRLTDSLVQQGYQPL